MTHEELIALAVKLLSVSALGSLTVQENTPTLSYNNADGSVTTETCNYDYFTITGRIDFPKKDGDGNA
jgi:hypothetical protein